LIIPRDFFKSKVFFYAVLLIAMMVQTFPFGLQYFPFSDDWFSLGAFSFITENIWQDAVLHYGLHGFRPVAGLLEVYVLSWFWPNMWPVLLAVTLMRFFTILMLDKILEKSNVTWGRVAAVFFAFFPALTESTYWLSASVRVVVGSFLSMLAAYAILKFLHKQYWERGVKWLVIAIVSGFLANGFYEQGIVFTFVLTMGVLLLHRDKIRSNLLYVWPFANLAAIIVHYIVFWNASSWLGERADVDLNIFQQFPRAVSMIVRVFYHEQFPTVSRAFRWGFVFLFREHLLLVIIIAILSVLLAFSVSADDTENENSVRSIVVALVLSVCTLSVFFVIADSWIYVRNYYYSLIGIAIIVEIFARLLPWRRVKCALLGMMMFVFLSGYVLEVDSLRRIERYDSKIIAQLVDKLDGDDSDEAWLFGTRWLYSPSINPRITSQIRMDWAATAHFRYLYTRAHGEGPSHWIIPVMNGQAVDLDFANPNIFGIDDDLQVRRLIVVGQDILFADSGEAFGFIEPADNGQYTFRLEMFR